VKVKVLAADAKSKRIALSMKALMMSDLPKIKHMGQNAPRPQRAERVAPTMEDKLAQLQDRFRKR
jgi:uncharacterized protein